MSMGDSPIKCQCSPHIETSQLICFANQLTGCYMRATLALNGLMRIVLQLSAELQRILHKTVKVYVFIQASFLCLNRCEQCKLFSYFLFTMSSCNVNVRRSNVDEFWILMMKLESEKK